MEAGYERRIGKSKESRFAVFAPVVQNQFNGGGGTSTGGNYVLEKGAGD